jgi:hypothetical protein
VLLVLYERRDLLVHVRELGLHVLLGASRAAAVVRLPAARPTSNQRIRREVPPPQTSTRSARHLQAAVRPAVCRRIATVRSASRRAHLASSPLCTAPRALGAGASAAEKESTVGAAAIDSGLESALMRRMRMLAKPRHGLVGSQQSVGRGAPRDAFHPVRAGSSSEPKLSEVRARV